MEESLEGLEREYIQVLNGGNPDRMDEFTKKSLNTFYEDLVWSKRNRAITKEQYHYFSRVYTTMADQMQETKRLLRKEDT